MSLPLSLQREETRRTQAEMQSLRDQNTIMSGGLTGDSLQYFQEATGALNAQARILPRTAELEAQLAPQLQQAQFAGVAGYSTGLLGNYQNLVAPTQQFQQQYSAGQLGIMGGLGQQANQAAIGSMDAVTQGIYGTYGRQVLADLQMGTGLTQQETEQAQQAARAAAQARGLQFSRQGSDLEILNTYNMGQKRYQQRQQAALAGYQMGQQQQAVGLQTFLNPAFAASQPFNVAGIYGASMQGYAGLGSNFLQPESQYLANIRANRIQAENAAAAASAQKSSGLAQGIGAVAGALLAKCWVAREVYGENNANWVFFRDWLESDAPRWLDELYEQEGERFANFIHDKPILKKAVKSVMDFILSRNS